MKQDVTLDTEQLKGLTSKKPFTELFPLLGQKNQNPLEMFLNSVRYEERSLSDNEIQWAKRIFGESMDLSKIRLKLYDSPSQNLTTGIVLPWDSNSIWINIHHFSSMNFDPQKDFCSDIKGAQFLMHELTHVWQNSSGNFWNNFVGNLPTTLNQWNSFAEEGYDIPDFHLNSLFSDFDIEGQGRIIEDYTHILWAQLVDHKESYPHYLFDSNTPIDEIVGFYDRLTEPLRRKS
jgi:hypothetical protein